MNAQKLQRLAEMLQEMERRQEAGGGEAHLVEEGLEEVAVRIGVDREILQLATPETLLHVLAPEGGGDPGKLWVVAEILYLERRRALARGDREEARAAGEKARLLYRKVGSDLDVPEPAPPPTERIQALTRS